MATPNAKTLCELYKGKIIPTQLKTEDSGCYSRKIDGKYCRNCKTHTVYEFEITMLCKKCGREYTGNVEVNDVD